MNKRIYLLPNKGNFYKANMHCHTTISDGKLTPKEVKEIYKQQGYSIIAYTDHRIYKNHEVLNDEEFLALAAVEIDINEVNSENLMPGDRTYHINLYDTNPIYAKKRKEQGILPELRYRDFDYMNKYLEEMKELGFLACYNHPFWSLQNYDDYKGLKGLFAMEIYNYGCELDGLYGYNPQAYDEMLRLGNRLWCLAADDNHNKYPFGHSMCDSFGGFIMIKAEELSLIAIVEALKKGNFYSSMGPRINELYIEEQELIVKTDPVQKIYVITDTKRCYCKAVISGESLTKASFKLDGNERYIRIQCRDEKGLYINSNAYFLSDIG